MPDNTTKQLSQIDEIKLAALEEMSLSLERALQRAVYNIIMELPEGYASTIATDIYIEKQNPLMFHLITTSDVWSYLNYGTGIYAEPPPMHRGAGPNGEIVPVTIKQPTFLHRTKKALEFTKYLHFKNKKIAAALGFPDANVFLKSVKGIRPRWYFERHIEGGRFDELLSMER